MGWQRLAGGRDAGSRLQGGGGPRIRLQGQRRCAGARQAHQAEGAKAEARPPQGPLGAPAGWQAPRRGRLPSPGGGRTRPARPTPGP